jgi:glutathione S-transferase
MDTHELTGIAFSHYVEKARWALDRFGVTYRDHRVLPFLHFAAVYRVHRGKLGKADRASTRFSTPVLRTDDGRILCDSASIVRYASERFAPPGQGLYEQPEAAELEQHFNDALGPHSRRVAYGAVLARPELFTQLVRHNVDARQQLAFRAVAPFAGLLLSRSLGIDARRVQSSVDKVRRELDLVSERLSDGRPFLLGDRFSAADLSFAALGSLAVLPPEYSAWLPPVEAFGPEVRARTLEMRQTPAGAFILRMFAEERRGRCRRRCG